MVQRKIKEIIIVVVFSVIPAILLYFSSSVHFFDYLKAHGVIGESLNIATIKEWCLVISIFLSALLLSLNLAFTKLKVITIENERNSLIKMIKGNPMGSIEKVLQISSSDYEIRIFVPKNPILYRIADRFRLSFIRKVFIIKNVSLIAEEGATRNLQFEVIPKSEGLVGKCYNNKRMEYDDNLESTNASEYELNHNQIAKTSSLQWSICCPVFDKNDNVAAIIALDGGKKITISNNVSNRLKQSLSTFSCMFYESIPSFFK